MTRRSYPQSIEADDSDAKYRLTSSTLKVHLATCPALRGGTGDRWDMPWEPGGHMASEFDEACRRCLPNGIPGALAPPDAPPKTLRQERPDVMTMGEALELLGQAAHLLQDAKPDGNDPGNRMTWGRSRKRIVNRVIDTGLW